jgi:hypothetical protein
MDPNQLDKLRERIEELKSWLKENSQGNEASQGYSGYRSCGVQCTCGYLAALQDALCMLSDGTDSLYQVPNSEKVPSPSTSQTRTTGDIPAVNNSAVVADALKADRRVDSRARRRGERRNVGPGSGVHGGRRRTDRIDQEH